jgi:hypothetical protein
MMVKKAVLAVGFASIMGVALTVMPAQASPLVTSWGYSVSDGITSWTCTDAGTGCARATNPNTSLLETVNGVASQNPPTDLRWGTECSDSIASGAGSCSSLNLGGSPAGQNSGTLTLNASPINTVSVTINNGVVSPPTITGATILDFLTLTPSGGSAIGPEELTFDIDYDETTNATPCLVAPTNGVPCPDLFMIANLQDAGFAYDSGTGEWSLQTPLPYLGNTYFIELELAGIQQFSNSVCLGVDSDDSISTSSADYLGAGGSACYGFASEENESQSIQATLAIDATALPTGVPEPATLALFGAGLLDIGGLATRRRRRMKTA